MRIIIFYSILAITLQVLVSCSEMDYYPKQDPSLSEQIYLKYKHRLDTAYLENNNFEVGVQLANLNAPPQKVFHFINKGINANPENCWRVYDWFEIYDDFKPNLVKSDTLAFLSSFDLCLNLLGNASYDDYIQEKHAKYQEKLAQRAKLDSTKFNFDLMSQLEIIRKDDQELRQKYDLDNLNFQDSVHVWNEIGKKDSVNLVKIEAILSEFGYPDKDLVGYDMHTVPWLVLHHQVDLSIRDKYLPLIEDNFKGGLVNTYKDRSELLRLKQDK